MPWAPTDVTGLIRWGKADSLGLANNDPVASYTDSSGTGNHFIASGAVRPTFKTNVQNSLAAILFDGTQNYLTRDALGATLSGTNTPFTFFWCGQHVTLAALHQCFFICANITGSSTPTHDLFWRHEGYNWWCDRRDDAALIKRVQGFEPDTNWHTLIYTFDGTTGIMYVDGISMASRNQSGAGASPP